MEIHTVGSPAALECVKRLAVSMGAVPAQPGEFTARAFLNGGMDLSEAEGVAALIRAQSDTQLRASRRMADGTLHGRVEELREALGELLALVEADIDFAEEPIEFITPESLRQRLAMLSARLGELLAGHRTQEQLDALPRILLLGPPNAGKSALMNALTGVPRALCAPIAGTTRDVLSAPLRLGSAEVVLLDAAGVDESADPLIVQARAVALAAAECVDLVCLVVDLTAAAADTLTANIRSLSLPRIIVAANKCDLVAGEDLRRALAWWGRQSIGPVYEVSALHRTGLDELRRALAEALGEAVVTAAGEGMALTERQQSAIREAADAMDRAAAISQFIVETIDCAETIAFELREALDALGAVTGAVTTDDLLARVFANFCIGK